MSANTKLWMPQLRHMPVSFIPLFGQVSQNHLLFKLRLASQSELSLPIHVGSCSFPFPVAKNKFIMGKSWEKHVMDLDNNTIFHSPKMLGRG